MKRLLCSLLGHKITGTATIQQRRIVSYCSRCEREFTKAKIDKAGAYIVKAAESPPADMPELAPGWLDRSLERAHRNIMERPEHLKPARYRRGA